MKPAKTLLARKAQFRCAHLYQQKEFSQDENRETFGLCYSPHGHGHTYTLEVYFNGEIDPLTGMIINLTEVDALLAKAIAPINDKHLNFEVPEFKEKIPTTENLAHYLYKNIRELLPSKAVQLSRMRLYESESLWVDLLDEEK